MAELEEIYGRKHYKLPIDWQCSKCGYHCRMKGKLLGEDPDPKSQLTWEQIIQKFCEKCRLIERPTRQCSYCSFIYDLNSSGCKKCDTLISTMIDLEGNHNDLLDMIKSKTHDKRIFYSE